MAEILAVVASGAGLASLALQLADGIERLRKRCEDLRKLRENIGNLIEDLELVALQLKALEADHSEVLEFPMGPTLLGRCQAHSEDVIKKLKDLIAVIPMTASRVSKIRILRALFKSKKWKIEFNELRSAVQDLKVDLIRVQLLQQGAFYQKCRPAISPSKDGNMARSTPCSNKLIAINVEMDETNSQRMSTIASKKSLWGSGRQYRQCVVLKCHCSCHLTKQVSSRFWYIQYTPLADMIKPCDNAACTARRHRVQFRAALSQIGIPWAVILGLDLTFDMGKFTLRPNLQLERVVKYTSPGFETLWKLSEAKLSWDDAQARFRELHRTDPTFCSQVDPSGHGYLQKVVERGWVNYAEPNFDNWLRLLQLFINEFGMSLGSDTLDLLLSCASWNWEGRHLVVVENLLRFGIDFSTSPAPQFESWPKPCPDDLGGEFSMSVIPPDPFFVEFLTAILRTNHDFGGTTALHQAILHGSVKSVKLLIQKCLPLENNINFLGQTPLHIAIFSPSRLSLLLDAGHNINARDKNGLTPLMYASAMNRVMAVSILIRRGAELFLQDYLEKYDFIMYAAVRTNWFIIWHALEVIESRDPSLLVGTFSRIISSPRPPLFLEEGRTWETHFLTCIVSKLKNLDVVFEDMSTLMHMVPLPQFAHFLLEHGFTALNQQDQHGEHSLFPITNFLDPRLARLLIQKGSDINLRNHKGHNVLCQVLGRLSHPQETEIKRILEYLDMLLKNGADVNSTDDCTCNCNPAGCLPISGLSLKIQWLFYRVNNPCWIFEWLYILADHEKLVEAKSNALSILRQVKFDEKGLVHTCCHLGSASNRLVPEVEFWETSRLIEVDTLNDEMTIWEARAFDEIVAELILHFKNHSTASRESTCSSPKEHEAKNAFPAQCPKDLDYETDYEQDIIYSPLDMIFRGGFLDRLDFSLMEYNYAEECVKEYISGLKSARNGDLSGRASFLTQLSTALNLSFD